MRLSSDTEFSPQNGPKKQLPAKQAAVHPARCENDCWMANLENEKAQANILKLEGLYIEPSLLSIFAKNGQWVSFMLTAADAS